MLFLFFLIDFMKYYHSTMFHLICIISKDFGEWAESAPSSLRALWKPSPNSVNLTHGLLYLYGHTTWFFAEKIFFCGKIKWRMIQSTNSYLLTAKKTVRWLCKSAFSGIRNFLPLVNSRAADISSLVLYIVMWRIECNRSGKKIWSLIRIQEILRDIPTDNNNNNNKEKSGTRGFVLCFSLRFYLQIGLLYWHQILFFCVVINQLVV